MAALVGKAAANLLLKKQAKQYVGKKVSGDEDPYFMYITDPRTGKQKKVKKQIPEYIPDHDALILAKMRKRAYKLDMALFELAGIRFGWSSVIGFIPFAGDFVDIILAMMLVWRCSKIECGLDATTLLLMLVNVAVDGGLGLIPILGDIIDGAFKANTRNVRLLEKRLDSVYKPTSGRDEKIVWNGKKRPPPPATTWEDFDDEDKERRDFIAEQDEQDRLHGSAGAATRDDTRRRTEAPPQRGGLFSGSRRGERQPDLERGNGVGRQAPLRERDDSMETGTVTGGRR